MADQQGQSPLDNQTPASGPLAGTPQDQADQGTQDLGGEQGGFQVPEKFSGKTPEEIIQSYTELERKIGEQSAELSALREQVRQPVPPFPYPTPNPYGGFQAPVPGPYPGYPPMNPMAPMMVPPGPVPQKELKWNWDNPTETLNEWAKTTIVPMLAGSQIATSKSMGEIAMANAKAANPALFEGVEQNVKAFMDNAITNGMLRPESALNPETWRMAAWQIKGMQSGYAPVAQNPGVIPMAPARTEIPGSRPPLAQGPAPSLSEADRRMSQMMGLTEEQARKNLMGRK